MPCGNDGYDTRVDAFVSWLDQVSGGDIVKPGAGPRTPGTTDKVPPSVSFTSHKDGQKLQPGPVTITGDASDNVGLAEVALVINGRVFGSKSAAPFSWSLQFVPGVKDLELAAVDTSGNVTQVAIKVTVEGQLSQFGDDCSSSVQCESRLCVYSRTLGKRYCSEVCSPTDNACPTNGTCVQTTQAGYFVCALNETGPAVPGGGSVQGPGATATPDTPQPRPEEPTTPQDPSNIQPRGGCAVANSADAANALPLWLALLGLALVTRRRRRRR